MEDLPERVSVNLARLHRNRRLDRHEAVFTQVCEENSDHAERKLNVGSEINHRCRRVRELQHGNVLRTEPARVRDTGIGCDNRGDQVEGLT
jgi:hypothetical protein